MRYNHLDMLPAKSFSPVGKVMTFEGGGGGGQSGGSTSTTGIDPMLKPYVEFGTQEAKKLYQAGGPQYYGGQTFVDPSTQTNQAITGLTNRATSGNPLLPSAQRQQQDVISGNYLQNNPFFNQAMGSAAQGATQTYNDAIRSAQGSTSMAGRYGSNVSADIQNRAATGLGNTLANKASELAFQNY
jgi:hypothetical protein